MGTWWVMWATMAWAGGAADRHLSAAEVAEDVALAEEAYRRIHPGYLRYADADEMRTAWQAVVDRAEAEQGLSVGDFTVQVSEVLARVRCDHTKAELPDDLREERRAQPMYLPIAWELVEGRAMVLRADPRAELTRGDELLSIDGHAMGELVASLAPLVPVDGNTDWSRTSQMSDSREFMGGAVDHFGALVYDWGPTAQLEVADATGAVREVTVDRTTYGDWRALADGDAGAANFRDAVTFERIGDRAAYLAVDTFVNYRDPVDPDAVYDPLFEALRVEGRDTLVLDLRKNGGGSSDAQMGLVARLLTEPLTPYDELWVKTLDLRGLREHLWTWDRRALRARAFPNRLGFRKRVEGGYALTRLASSDLRTIRPHPLAFEGRLIVLTSSANSSASTILLALLSEHRGAQLVGERTGGSATGPTAGLLYMLTLPHSGVRARVPFIRHVTHVERFREGLGVTPDIEVVTTVEAWREGRDPARERAEALAAGQGVELTRR